MSHTRWTPHSLERGPTAEDRTRYAAPGMLDEALGETADFLRTEQSS